MRPRSGRPAGRRTACSDEARRAAVLRRGWFRGGRGGAGPAWPAHLRGSPGGGTGEPSPRSGSVRARHHGARRRDHPRRAGPRVRHGAAGPNAGRDAALGSERARRPRPCSARRRLGRGDRGARCRPAGGPVAPAPLGRWGRGRGRRQRRRRSGGRAAAPPMAPTSSPPSEVRGAAVARKATPPLRPLRARMRRCGRRRPRPRGATATDDATSAARPSATPPPLSAGSAKAPPGARAAAALATAAAVPAAPLARPGFASPPPPDGSARVPPGARATEAGSGDGAPAGAPSPALPAPRPAGAAGGSAGGEGGARRPAGRGRARRPTSAPGTERALQPRYRLPRGRRLQVGPGRPPAGVARGPRDPRPKMARSRANPSGRS